MRRADVAIDSLHPSRPAWRPDLASGRLFQTRRLVVARLCAGERRGGLQEDGLTTVDRSSDNDRLQVSLKPGCAVRSPVRAATPSSPERRWRLLPDFRCGAGERGRTQQRDGSGESLRPAKCVTWPPPQAACICMSLRRKSITVVSVLRDSASDTLEWSMTSIGG